MGRSCIALILPDETPIISSNFKYIKYIKSKKHVLRRDPPPIRLAARINPLRTIQVGFFMNCDSLFQEL